MVGYAKIVFAAIPVKAAEKKSRLSNLMKPNERALLTYTMLRDVLHAVLDSQAHSKVAVISSDPETLRIAYELGTHAILEKGQGLNNAVEQVTRWCMREGAGSVLILPSDIPLLTVEDVNQLIHLGSGQLRVVVAPSVDGGTNALLRIPPDIIPPFFGPYSFQRHISEAEAVGVKAEVYRSPTVALDIDTTKDLGRLLVKPGETETHELLRRLNLYARLKKT